jgi:hypothetical protein
MSLTAFFDVLKIRISHGEKSGMQAAFFEHPPPPHDIKLMPNCFGELTEGWWTIMPLFAVWHIQLRNKRTPCDGRYSHILHTAWNYHYAIFMLQNC